MKLQNKKTGESYETTMPIVFNIKTNGGGEHTVSCESITALNDAWEDAPEEPKEHWAIDQFGEPINVSGLSRLQLEKLHRLGNDFPSENATIKAIDKLKAWKRLEEKGFRFERWGIGGEYGNTITFSDYIEYNDKTRADLDLLFGGEE